MSTERYPQVISTEYTRKCVHHDKKNLYKYFNAKFIETWWDLYKLPFPFTIARGAQIGGH